MSLINRGMKGGKIKYSLYYLAARFYFTPGFLYSTIRHLREKQCLDSAANTFLMRYQLLLPQHSATKQGLSGYWSRRVTNEHRIVYKAEDNAVLIAQLRSHYQNFGDTILNYA